MTKAHAAALAANPQVFLEPDQPLVYDVVSPLVQAVPATDPAVAVPLAESVRLTVQVRGADGPALEGVHVWAVGSTAPTHAVSDAYGNALLALPTDTATTLRALHVRPRNGYWPARIEWPTISDDGDLAVLVEVQPLSDLAAEFPDRPLTGWGQQAMRTHQLPRSQRGDGIRIALLDSGISREHPDLKDAARTGYDFVAGSDQTWASDPTGHGTWCAGVIAAADNGTGITGVAADAELHACKLYPGGRVSHLLQALDYCIGHGIDIAQLNLGCAAASQLLALKILDTHTAGTAVIVPAGDNGVSPAFPASLSTVLVVGAIGHTVAHPADPRARDAGPLPTRPGSYAPSFTPPGPGVDLAAPGVAVITTAPTYGYTPADGTALAAAHIAGLAAVLLAHHEQLRALPRHSARTTALWTVLHASCQPIPLDPMRRTGAGLPDAPTALGLRTPAIASPASPEPASPKTRPGSSGTP
ncbi:S8 family serine peptidase [Kitasatospora sp. NPDC057904]|uniref:S8 family serine peptidase n=1 Tax=unclassified Kitasatospora TaxID=2633591 RepID=UPI0036DECD41